MITMWPFTAFTLKSLSVARNNAFRKFFNACWSRKPKVITVLLPLPPYFWFLYYILIFWKRLKLAIMHSCHTVPATDCCSCSQMALFSCSLVQLVTQKNMFLALSLRLCHDFFLFLLTDFYLCVGFVGFMGVWVLRFFCVLMCRHSDIINECEYIPELVSVWKITEMSKIVLKISIAFYIYVLHIPSVILHSMVKV